MRNRGWLRLQMLLVAGLVGCFDSGQTLPRDVGSTDVASGVDARASGDVARDMAASQDVSIDRGRARDLSEAVEPPGLELEMSSGTVKVRNGSPVSPRVDIERSGSFTGAVSLSVTGLPAGVSAETALVPIGEDVGWLTFEAEDSAAHAGPLPIEVRGTANGGELVATLPMMLFVAGEQGELDTSFGNGGTVVWEYMPGAHDAPRAGFVLPDGDLVVGGYNDSVDDRAFVLRFAPDGRLEPSFGTDGVYTAFGGQSSVVGDVIGSDFGIVMLVQRRAQDYSVSRFLRGIEGDGAPHAVFGTNGDVQLGAGGIGVVRRSDGYLLYGRQLAAAYDADGRVDGAFVPGTLPVWIESVSVDAQNRTLLGEVAASGPFRIARLTPSGGIDASFGVDGVAEFPTPVGEVTPRVNYIATTEEGGVAVVSSEWGTYQEVSIGLLRFTTEGTVPADRLNAYGEVHPQAFFQDAIQETNGGIVILYSEVTAPGFTEGRLTRWRTSADGRFGDAGVLPVELWFGNILIHDPYGGRVIVGTTNIDGELVLRRYWLL